MLPFERSSIEEIYQSRFIECNNVQILYKGRESFDAIFRSIEQASLFVCLQFYIFRNDETGAELARILKKKAQEGIKIYILYDHFGSLGTPRKFWNELRNSGISIRASRPFKWSSPFHYVQRDHRKLIIVDGALAFTGGLNIANEYRGFHIRLKMGWRDTGILLKGPIASALFHEFHKTWMTWRGEPITFSGLPETAPFHEPPSACLPVIPIFASSSRGRRRMRKLLYYSIHNSRTSIILTTAYFTPSRRMIDSLEEAVRRGVTVSLLIPGKSDVPAASYAGRAFFSRLLRAGIRIFAYQGEVLHAKSYVFDGCWSIVGSANLDFLSLRRNDEGNVGILNGEFGRMMTGVFREDTEHAREITMDDWAKRPFSERAKEWFFALFRRRL